MSIYGSNRSIVAIAAVCVAAVTASSAMTVRLTPTYQEITPVTIEQIPEEPEIKEVQTVASTSNTIEITIPDTAETIAMEDYYAELTLLACLVQAEAGNQDMRGKRLVVDTVLNRVDHPDFPDTITDVIYQKYQFSTVWDGALERAYWTVTEDCYEAVRLELEGRMDPNVLYFTAFGYGQYGTPAYQAGDHYFCYE